MFSLPAERTGSCTLADRLVVAKFVDTGVTAELIHLPCHLVRDGKMCDSAVSAVTTCAVTDRLREKMLIKPSDIKLLEDSDSVMTSYRDK